MDSTTLKGQQATVIGGARSGLAVARLLRQAHANVFLTERGPASEGLEATLRSLKVKSEFDGHTTRALDADFVVISPGVPTTAAIVQQALRRKLPVFSEIEVASWFCPAPIVAITGTNGKTTTTSLTAFIFKQAGRDYIVGGNIGYPFSDYVLGLTPESVAVLEISSFQLDHIDRFRPKVSVLLNITPDHLDRYQYDYNAYAQSKFRIFKNQGPDDVLVYNHDDELVRAYITDYVRRHPTRAVGFSLHDPLPEGAFVRDGQIVLRLNQTEELLMSVDQLALRGTHNRANSLAAAISGRLMEIRSDIVRESLMRFEGVPHRLEFVREVEGARYINDSKATNVNAVWYALESYQEPIVLIAGGRDKGNDYKALRRLASERVKVLIGIGESGDQVVDSLGAVVPTAVRVYTMEEALQTAHQLAEPGDVVLLSPACSSFDMFENYEDRGDTFKRLVANL